MSNSTEDNPYIGIETYSAADIFLSGQSKLRSIRQSHRKHLSGNFCQLVWLGSHLIGVGRATHSLPSSLSALVNHTESGSDGGFSTGGLGTAGYTGFGDSNLGASTKTVIVCFYHPPGNILGQFTANCKSPLPVDTIDIEETGTSSREATRTKE